MNKVNFCSNNWYVRQKILNIKLRTTIILLSIKALTWSVMHVNGCAGLAHSICRRVAVSISHTDTSLFPLTAEIIEEGWDGWGFSCWTLWICASGAYMFVWMCACVCVCVCVYDVNCDVYLTWQKSLNSSRFPCPSCCQYLIGSWNRISHITW